MPPKPADGARPSREPGIRHAENSKEAVQPVQHVRFNAGRQQQAPSSAKTAAALSVQVHAGDTDDCCCPYTSTLVDHSLIRADRVSLHRWQQQQRSLYNKYYSAKPQVVAKGANGSATVAAVATEAGSSGHGAEFSYSSHVKQPHSSSAPSRSSSSNHSCIQHHVQCSSRMPSPPAQQRPNTQPSPRAAAAHLQAATATYADQAHSTHSMAAGEQRQRRLLRWPSTCTDSNGQLQHGRLREVWRSRRQQMQRLLLVSFRKEKEQMVRAQLQLEIEMQEQHQRVLEREQQRAAKMQQAKLAKRSKSWHALFTRSRPPPTPPVSQSPHAIRRSRMFRAPAGELHAIHEGDEPHASITFEDMLQQCEQLEGCLIPAELLAQLDGEQQQQQQAEGLRESGGQAVTPTVQVTLEGQQQQLQGGTSGSLEQQGSEELQAAVFDADRARSGFKQMVRRSKKSLRKLAKILSPGRGDVVASRC